MHGLDRTLNVMDLRLAPLLKTAAQAATDANAADATAAAATDDPEQSGHETCNVEHDFHIFEPEPPVLHVVDHLVVPQERVSQQDCVANVLGGGVVADENPACCVLIYCHILVWVHVKPGEAELDFQLGKSVLTGTVVTPDGPQVGLVAGLYRGQLIQKVVESC